MIELQSGNEEEFAVDPVAVNGIGKKNVNANEKRNGIGLGNEKDNGIRIENGKGSEIKIESEKENGIRIETGKGNENGIKIGRVVEIVNSVKRYNFLFFWGVVFTTRIK